MYRPDFFYSFITYLTFIQPGNLILFLYNKFSSVFYPPPVCLAASLGVQYPGWHETCGNSNRLYALQWHFLEGPHFLLYLYSHDVLIAFLLNLRNNIELLGLNEELTLLPCLADALKPFPMHWLCTLPQRSRQHTCQWSQSSNRRILCSKSSSLEFFWNCWSHNSILL